MKRKLFFATLYVDVIDLQWQIQECHDGNIYYLLYDIHTCTSVCDTLFFASCKKK